MARRHHYRKKGEQPQELDVTTFLNLMVVLIPFLLVTAVFSKITIQELNLPAQAAGGATPDKPLVTIEVMVRKNGLEIGDEDGDGTPSVTRERSNPGDPLGTPSSLDEHTWGVIKKLFEE